MTQFAIEWLPSSRPRVATVLLVVALLLSAGACESPSVGRSSLHWRAIPLESLSPRGGPQAEVMAVQAGGAGRPWLLGGVIPEATPYSDGFRTFPMPTVAIWRASSVRGPWRRANLHADPQRDGPNETIYYLSSYANLQVSFGWRNSPTEGYPRPSAWSGSTDGGTWQEIIEPREFFGGPSIVGFGGATTGPHGSFVAGTWLNPAGVPVISVWRSVDGRTWTQDATASALTGRDGEIPFAAGVADGAGGVMVIGASEIPSPSDPSARRGALYFSPDGSQWIRLDETLVANRWPQSAFGAVAAFQRGWVVAGTVKRGALTEAGVWMLQNEQAVPRFETLTQGPASAAIKMTSVSVGPAGIIVAGVDRGRLVIWRSSVSDGKPTGWRQLEPPTADALSTAHAVTVASGSEATALVVQTSRGSQLWTTTG